MQYCTFSNGRNLDYLCGFEICRKPSWFFSLLLSDFTLLRIENLKYVIHKIVRRAFRLKKKCNRKNMKLELQIDGIFIIEV